MVNVIWIKEKTKDVLENLKVHPRQSYNDVIERLIENETSN